ncbi:MAG: MMPL family transporter [Actinobacteria bacterium]|nr:MMPL family transporter [Actinomycetota bacterium]
MTALARTILRHRWTVVGIWLVLTVFGAFSAGQVSKRWFESFSIPGYSAYEANQRTIKAIGTGENAPLVIVVKAPGDVTKAPGTKAALDAAIGANPGARSSSFFSTGNDLYVSKDRHTTFAEIVRPGLPGFGSDPGSERTQRALDRSTHAGVQAYVTGRDPIELAADKGASNGPSILTETLIGGLGALIILLFVFGTLPAIAMPLVTAIASILNTFTLVWLLTYVTNVSIIVQFLIALVGLGVSIDYALLIIFRFREELRHGQPTEEAIVTTMQHAGRSVIVSGSTVAVGLVSMVLLPLPFIRSIGIGGMLIPAVSVLASITLLPAMLALLGPRINRARVMPKRIVEGSDTASGFWGWWAGVVTKRAGVTAAIGIVIVAALLIPGVQLNPSEALAKDRPGGGPAIEGRTAIYDAGISAGVFKPFEVLVEGAPTEAQLQTITARLRSTPGIDGAVAPTAWRGHGAAVIEAIPSDDGASKTTKHTISALQHDVLPAVASATGLQVTLGGVSAEDQDFVHAVYGNFPYVLLFVVLLTYLLLARAFRSLILPLKAVILNLISLGAAYGIVVFIFQWGHGAQAIWNVPATNAIIPWIPLMIFAFLYGLSMDYEVFMLTRMREAYDESGDTTQAIALGLSRTGKLVTSAALVLCLAFFILSTSPGTDIKQFGIGLSAGVIFDATVIRALLVPSLMQLLGRWNWWFPRPVARLLLADSPPEPASAVD